MIAQQMESNNICWLFGWMFAQMDEATVPHSIPALSSVLTPSPHSPSTQHISVIHLTINLKEKAPNYIYLSLLFVEWDDGQVDRFP